MEEKDNKNILLKPGTLHQTISKKSVLFSHKTMSLVLGVCGIVIVILIIGVGALLAGHVWNPKWNPFRQSTVSDNVIREKIFKK